MTRRRAVLATVHGPVPAHLHLRTLAGLNESAWSGSHLVLLNSDHRIYVSDDGGRHWREQ